MEKDPIAAERHVPISVYEELNITLLAIGEVALITSGEHPRVPVNLLYIEPAEDLACVAGKFDTNNMYHFNFRASYANKARTEISLQIERQESDSGSSYKTDYIAANDGYLYEVVDSEDDLPLAVKLDEAETEEILTDIRACHVRSMA